MRNPFRKQAPALTEPATLARLTATETHTKALYDETAELRAELRVAVRELQQLRQDEARRAAEHATMVDQLTRLYKRVSARIEREAQTEDQRAARNSVGHVESVAELRRRLGR